jgi:preprotein translocase subunit SecG
VIAFLTVLHVIIALLLVTSILMQAGKGGGLAEGFSSAENLLGAQTNTVMIKVTTVLTALFFMTSVTLAILNSKQGSSLMTRLPSQTKSKKVDVDELFKQKPTETITINAAEPMPAEEVPAASAVTNSVAN